MKKVQCQGDPEFAVVRIQFHGLLPIPQGRAVAPAQVTEEAELFVGGGVGLETEALTIPVFGLRSLFYLQEHVPQQEHQVCSGRRSEDQRLYRCQGPVREQGFGLVPPAPVQGLFGRKQHIGQALPSNNHLPSTGLAGDHLYLRLCHDTFSPPFASTQLPARHCFSPNQ